MDFHRIHVVPKKKTINASEKLAHCMYFGLVFMEGHAYYAIAGGILLVYHVADMIFHYSEGE